MKQLTIQNKEDQKKSSTTSTAKFEIPNVESTLEKIEEEQEQEDEDAASTFAALLFMGLAGRLKALKKKAQAAAENERLSDELDQALRDQDVEEEQSRGCGCGW